MIHELDESLRLKIEDSWEGRSGLLVEDFISRNIITEGSYGDDEILRLKNKLGTDIVEIPVSVVLPTYDYAICLYGLKVNGTVHKDASLVMQYKNNTKVELGIGIRSVMDRGGVIKNYNTTFKVDITFNNQSLSTQIRNIDYNYFELLNGNYVLGAHEDLEEALMWVDVTRLFTKIAKNKKISASFKPGDLKLESELNINIVNEILNLVYNGNTVINTNLVLLTFESSQINILDYKLVYYINGKGNGTNPYISNVGDFIITNLTPGLNLVVMRAENHLDSKICSDWISFNVIYTEGFTGTAVAVNGVNNGITNNGVATLYKLIIYSTNREEFEFTTYLENAEPSEIPTPTQIIKQEYITAYSYDRETNTTDEYTYKKYIELENTGSAQYLLIKVKNQFYTFYRGNYSPTSGSYSVYSSPFIEMKVEECIPEYTYVKSYPISYNFDQITGQANNLFITELQSPTRATLISDLESSDGWKELDGLTYLKLSKQGKSVLKNPINLNLNDSFTIELGFKTYNISDKSQTIMTLGKLALWPTLLGWIYEDMSSEAFLKRNSQFQEGQNTHVVITVTKNWNINNNVYYPDYLGEVQGAFDEKAKQVSYNLVRIYINGCIDREFILNDIADLNTLKNSLLDIQPKSSDIDLYLFRVYNTHALSHEEVIKNYISFIPQKTGVFSKESVYNKNDITDDSGKISWPKCIGKQNTLLFIYHKGGRFPNRFWGLEDNESSNDANKKIPCTLVINYADPTINARYGGVLDKLQCKGLGSSAMRYLIWNVNSSLNKFKYKAFDELGQPILDEEGKQKEKKAESKFLPYSNLLTRDGRGDLLPENTNVDEVISKYYAMPPYENEQDTTVYKYDKMVGKVNFASSMQSHKIGACKLYDDAYKKSLGTASLPSGGKKAVHEEPFMYFYIETDEPFNADYSSELDIDSITYTRILELGENAKFMGFLTWGPGKGDEAASGYDEDNTPEYLMLEGGENTDASVNFLRPWQALQRLRTDFERTGAKYNYAIDLKPNPTVSKAKSLEEPWSQLLIDDESIVYTDRGAWDIDFGFSEDEVGDTTYFDIAGDYNSETKECTGVKKSLKVFREFYDMVYKYDFTFIRVDSKITAPQLDWNIHKKYLVAAPSFYINGVSVSGHQAGDIYRYDEPTATWVKAGVYYDNGWERLNYRQLIEQETGEIAQTETQIRDILKALFIKHVKDYIHLDDIAFHQAFIKFLSGTDNRAKNTYFQIIGTMADGGGDYKIRLIGDDLDTILVTDNSGLQSKPYNLIEDSYDESYEKTWGDAGNIFFRMFDLSFEQEIKALLKNIMDFAGLQSSGINLQSGYFYKVFFKVQEDYPALAYNHTASIYYENAYVIKNCGASYGFDYTHNNVDPIALSHGSCLECEKLFMKERIDFLSGYAKSCLGNSLATSSAGAGGLELKLLMEFEPFQDFYPTYFYDGKVPNIGIYSDSEHDIIKYKATAGNTYTLTIREEAPAINQMLYQMNMYKTLSITGLLVDNLNASFDTTTDLTIDNKLLDENKDLFGDSYPEVSFVEFTPNFPVLENLNLINVSLPKELNLSTFYKLQSINLSGSNTESVIFPQTGILKNMILPDTIKTFEVYNNPNLESVTFEGYNNIETVYIDCAKCGQFDVSQFCENIKNSPLKSVTIRNANFNITEEALSHIIAPGTEYNIEGTITIVESLGSTTPKNISFMTKYLLVNSFGNIDTGQHGLVVKYAVSRITEMFEYPRQVNAYYDSKSGGSQSFENCFSINIIEGNNVKIKEGTNPFNSKVNSYLDISYKLQSQITGVSINNISGTLTLTQLPATNARVVITVNTTDDSFSNSSNPTEVSFKWVAPSIGDFAYADGSFSRSVNPQKTMIGLVYAKSSDSDNRTGTVYIVGKEYANDAHYSWYTTNGANSAVSGVPNNIHELNTYVNKNFNLSSTVPDFDDSLIDDSFINDITVENGNDVMLSSMTGKSDTNAYVKYVNSYMLSKIYNLITKTGIESSGGNYYIKNKENLNNLCSALEKSSIISGAGSVESSLVFPYFYSAYVYEPTLMFANETLNDLYKSGKWFAPSYGELARIIYYRGYSARGSQFSSASNVADDINVNMQDLGTTLGTPIFSIAAKALNLNFPDCWKNIINTNTNTSDIIGSLNIVTTAYTTATPDSYTYQAMQSSTNYTTSTRETHYEWIRGGNVIDLWYNNGEEQDIRAWAYKKHLGLPFTEFNYVNPLEE